MWESLQQRLEKSHTTLVPDLPGHGLSAGRPYVSHAHTVHELVEKLAKAVPGSPVTVIGFSLGAQLAIHLASEHPALVHQAVIVSAQAKTMPFTNFTLKALSVTAPLARKRWFAKLQARELFISPHQLEDYIATSSSISRESLVAAVGENMRFSPPPGWHTFPGRTLVMVGQRERQLMRDSAMAVHSALPSSEYEVVNGLAHGIPLQRPEWFNQRIATWIDEGGI